jgi:outer membrane biosynthesis protein TonB
MGLHEMADELTREEAIERLGAIYNAALEGEDLEKRLATIPKTLDKYEGKWSGLIKAAEKKYGKPEADESEGKPAKKRGGLFSRRRKPEEEPEEAPAEEPGGGPEEEPKEEPEEAPAEESGGEPEEEPEEAPAEESGGEPEEEPEATIDEPVEVPEDEPDVGGHEDLIDSEKSKTSLGKAAGISDEGNSEGALEVLKGLISSDGGNPEVWRGLASYFASAGRPGRARACEERADELS